MVIPCFNLGAYLDEAVQSVLDQTYQDFEIIVVDDGSDDPVTRHLLASYRRPKTRIVRIENRGVAGARNAGLRDARGNYVSFLDADDILEPQFLERTVERLESEPSLSFASCWLRAFGERTFEWTPERCDFPWLLAEDTVCTAALTRRDALVEVGGFDEDERVDGYEDWELGITLVERGFRGVIVPGFLFRYRIRRGSKSAERTAPESHARIVEYVVSKHNETYRAHAGGVIDVIAGRIAQLEEELPSAPVRPQVDLSGDGWRPSILALENHRRAVEEAAMAGSWPDGERAATPGELDWGSLRRLEPVSRVWGLDRGRPVDRYYIEEFLGRHASSIAGHVLEVKDSGYASRFGALARSISVIDVTAQNSEATLVADLSHPDALPEDRYDCFILTQTIHVIYEIDEVIRNAYRALAPGGVVLATLPCVSRVDYESGIDSDFWRFTPASARRLFERQFGATNVNVEAYGNLLACTAFLQGLAAEDLEPAELDRVDPYFPLLVAVRATKPGARKGDGIGAIEGRHDTATCGSVTGWVWEPAAPERRLRLEVWRGDHLLGRTTADGYRVDLEEASKGEGRVAFHFTPGEDLHGHPLAEICVTLAGRTEPLAGSPRVVECTCGRQAGAEPDSSPLIGAHLDLPRPGSKLTLATLDIAGWALARQAPVEAVELLCGGEVFRRVPVNRPRPDLGPVFPHVPWAARAGFAARLSLIGAGSLAELEVAAVLPSGGRTVLGRIAGPLGQRPAAEPVTLLIDAHGQELDPDAAPLLQDSSVARALVRGAPGALPGQPDFRVVSGWEAALDTEDGLVWLSDGQEQVAADFLTRAAECLREHPAAAFVAAAEPDDTLGDGGLVAVLGGTALGVTVVVRAEAARAVGGFDERAPSPAAAQWDLCVRLASVGGAGARVDAVAKRCAPTLAEAAGEQAARWLYRKHADLFRRHLRAVVLEGETRIGRSLRQNHLSERELEEELLRLARAHRRERGRLGARVRRLSAGETVPTSDKTLNWGNFRRMEPVSALWGSDRGLRVDQHYIEGFLERHAQDVHGTVLEVHGSVYARRYGEARLERCDVVDVDPTNPSATIVTDLRRADALESASYDCVILTQVLHLIDDPAAALRECYRVLKPRGVLLATVPCVGRIDDESGVDGDYWRFTAAEFRRLLDDAFSPAEIDLREEGDSVSVIAFLAGLAAEDIGPEVKTDGAASMPLVLTVRAVKRRHKR